MYARSMKALIFSLALATTSASLAATDPTVHEIYAALQAGHVVEAQQMVQQVLADHPSNGKAHYVAAEVDARAGDLQRARQELATAEQLSPGLAFAPPASVEALQRQLGGPMQHGRPYAAQQSRPTFPSGLVIGLGIAVIAILWVLFRRRATPTTGYAPTPVSGAPGFGSPGYGQPGYYGGPPSGGSGILGNVATGMAVGAGVVAGEELARHFLEPAHAADRPRYDVADDTPANSDMGGNDFGVSDSGSWDDGGGAGGGGDDWS